MASRPKARPSRKSGAPFWGGTMIRMLFGWECLVGGGGGGGDEPNDRKYPLEALEAAFWLRGRRWVYKGGVMRRPKP